MAKRTTHRSTAGKKLYAVRDASGKFKDIQTYERAHSADLRKKAAPEKAKAAEKAGEEAVTGAWLEPTDASAWVTDSGRLRELVPVRGFEPRSRG